MTFPSHTISMPLAPLSVVFGHLYARVCRCGEAGNHRWAVIGLVLGYVVTAPLVEVLINLVLNLAGASSKPFLQIARINSAPLGWPRWRPRTR